MSKGPLDQHLSLICWDQYPATEISENMVGDMKEVKVTKIMPRSSNFEPIIGKFHYEKLDSTEERVHTMDNKNINSKAHESGLVPFYIIWNPDSTAAPKQTFERTEEGLAEAELAAKKLARSNTGQRFFILEAVSSFCSENPVVKREFKTKK